MNSGAQQSKATTPLQSQLQFQGHYKVECLYHFHMEVIVNREKQANTFTLEDYETFTKPLTTSETNVPRICVHNIVDVLSCLSIIVYIHK